jgi:hypothetical protein
MLNCYEWRRNENYSQSILTKKIRKNHNRKKKKQHDGNLELNPFEFWPDFIEINLSITFNFKPKCKSKPSVKH